MYIGNGGSRRIVGTHVFVVSVLKVVMLVLIRNVTLRRLLFLLLLLLFLFLLRVVLRLRISHGARCRQQIFEGIVAIPLHRCLYPLRRRRVVELFSPFRFLEATSYGGKLDFFVTSGCVDGVLCDFQGDFLFPRTSVDGFWTPGGVHHEKI